MPEVSEYAFGLVLGVLIILLFCLQTLEPHQPNIVQQPSPPPSPPLTPHDPNLPIEPYDEKTIINSITVIYELLLDLKYLERDEIIFPPPSGHVINLDICQTLNLDQRVVSLMQQLPYPKDVQTSLDFDLIDETRSPVYTDDDDIEECRDPENAGTPEDIRLDYLLPTDVALTIGKRYGTNLVLDTKENTIRSVECQDGPPFHESMERPDEQSHYRNYPAEPALEVLRRYAHKYRSLASIPRRYGYPLSRWDRKKVRSFLKLSFLFPFF
ncbi:uncharacterized protein LY89DRAFT_684036 [Mollisia scopiformis]|uniref:Uncharacterized protein n=1 Tax=Mollisia scopiformis TaxID=149040 RepID=A0A194XEC5_MOLSC|nr:uncharacterized protein LY89DRAFT_684036 [Mollisia scopiformis]KUJ18112.1 hypothetical protein LY89DRAFT_684036 [Mollisia scopiformis]